MTRRFVTLDVFTQERFAGNPLAIALTAATVGGFAVTVSEGAIEA